MINIKSYRNAIEDLVKDSNGNAIYPFDYLLNRITYITDKYGHHLFNAKWRIAETTAEYMFNNWRSKHQVFAIYLLVDKYYYDESALRKRDVILQANLHGITTDDVGIIYDIDINKFEETLYLFTAVELGLI